MSTYGSALGWASALEALQQTQAAQRERSDRLKQQEIENQRQAMVDALTQRATEATMGLNEQNALLNLVKAYPNEEVSAGMAQRLGKAGLPVEHVPASGPTLPSTARSGFTDLTGELGQVQEQFSPSTTTPELFRTVPTTDVRVQIAEAKARADLQKAMYLQGELSKRQQQMGEIQMQLKMATSPAERTRLEQGWTRLKQDADQIANQLSNYQSQADYRSGMLNLGTYSAQYGGVPTAPNQVFFGDLLPNRPPPPAPPAPRPIGPQQTTGSDWLSTIFRNAQTVKK